MTDSISCTIRHGYLCSKPKTLIKPFQSILASFVLDTEVSIFRDSGSRMTNQMADGFQFHTQRLHNRNISNAAAVGRQKGHTINGREAGLMALFALISWLRNPYNGNHAEVAVNRLENKELVLMYVLTAVVTFGFYFILDHFNTANMIPSTLSVTTSFIAVYLTSAAAPTSPWPMQPTMWC